jgi:hypothetical protein
MSDLSPQSGPQRTLIQGRHHRPALPLQPSAPGANRRDRVMFPELASRHDRGALPAAPAKEPPTAGGAGLSGSRPLPHLAGPGVRTLPRQKHAALTAGVLQTITVAAGGRKGDRTPGSREDATGSATRGDGVVAPGAA